MSLVLVTSISANIVVVLPCNRESGGHSIEISRPKVLAHQPHSLARNDPLPNLMLHRWLWFATRAISLANFGRAGCYIYNSRSIVITKYCTTARFIGICCLLVVR